MKYNNDPAGLNLIIYIVILSLIIPLLTLIIKGLYELIKYLW